MRLKAYGRQITVLALGLLLLGAVRCSSDSNGTNSTNSTNSIADGGTDKDGQLADTQGPQPDQAPAAKPVIEQLVPADGPANGGTAGSIPITMIGKNFDADMSVFVDGGTAVIIQSVKFTSAVSVSFSLPKNPYGPPYTAAKVTIQALVKGVGSNLVDFQYTESKDMDADFTGEITTANAKAFRDFTSEPFEAKIKVTGVTDAGGTAPAGLKAQVGIGKVGEDPRADYSFKWFEATYKADDGDSDVFVGVPTPPLTQPYDVAFRFSKDGGATWVYVDTKASDNVYTPADAAKLAVQDAPSYYCKEDAHCATQKYRAKCLVDADWTQNQCVECIDKDADCTGNPNALGPTCDTAKKICGCDDNTQCASNPNGKACGQGYCGCGSDADCDTAGGQQCVEDKKNGIVVCG